MYYGGYGYYYFDPTYILVIICAIISMFASARVEAVFNKYSRVAAASGLTGAEAAKRILNAAGIYDVSVEHVSGKLSVYRIQPTVPVRWQLSEWQRMSAVTPSSISRNMHR